MGRQGPRCSQHTEGAVPRGLRGRPSGISRSDDRDERAEKLVIAAGRLERGGDRSMDKVTVFIALTGIAVFLQAGVLLAMYLAMRQTTARIEAIASEVKAKAVPALEKAEAVIIEISPKLQVIADNLQDTTDVLRA